MKRVKADSWAARLSPEQREDLFVDFHESRLSCEEAAERASQLSGRRVTTGMLSNWYRGQRAAWVLAQAGSAAERAALEAPEDLDDRATLAVRQATFAAVMEALTPEQLAAFERNQLSREKLELQREQLRLDREKWEEAKRRAALADQTEDALTDKHLSEAEKAARIREIYGLQ